ncbi:MAG: ATP-binding cassette domain-containing protein [Candidatus Bipolaricaulota bacterium]|nr:ATP-binding cassette domain-containing protein [Candidatus Bipolaricaulota bacterium]
MIRIEGLRLEYRDGRQAVPVLDNLCLDIAAGESIAILGPSGCGKTSLLYAICGLVKPSSGQVIVDGQPVERPRRDVALILQDLGLLPWKTVWKNASLSLELGGAPLSAPALTTEGAEGPGRSVLMQCRSRSAGATGRSPLHFEDEALMHEWRRRRKSPFWAYFWLLVTGVWAAGQRFYLDRPFSAAVYLVTLGLWAIAGGFYWNEMQKIVEFTPDATLSTRLWGGGWPQILLFLVVLGLSAELLSRLIYDLFTMPRQIREANLLIAQQVQSVKPILDELGLDSRFYDRYPHQLSGGERQRVALARALATHPKVLLMDEPLAALDAFNRERIQDLLFQLWKERGFTQIIVTHDVQEAVFLGSRIVVLTERPARVKAIIENPCVGTSRTSAAFYEKVLELRRELA